MGAASKQAIARTCGSRSVFIEKEHITAAQGAASEGHYSRASGTEKPSARAHKFICLSYEKISKVSLG